jgi:hypothetical protein
VTAPTRYSAWAVGQAGTSKNPRPLIVHWNGKTWNQVTINLKGVPLFIPTTVLSSSASNVWAIGWHLPVPDNLDAFVYNGKWWSLRKLPSIVQGVYAVLSGSSVWASGGFCPSTPLAACTTLLHWNGSTWLSSTMSGATQSATAAGGHAWFLGLTHLSAPGGSSQSGRPVIHEATGNKVSTIPAPATRLMTLPMQPSIAASPSGQLWVLGRLATAGHPLRLFHWTGRTWQTIGIPQNVCPAGYGGYCPLMPSAPLAYDGKAGVWAGSTAHWTGAHWVNGDFYASSLLLAGISLPAVAAIPGTDSAWGAGTEGDGSSSSLGYGIVALFGPKP